MRTMQDSKRPHAFAMHGLPFRSLNLISLNLQNETKVEYDKVIQETEAAYLKILESSQTLLTVLKREAVNISKKKQASS